MNKLFKIISEVLSPNKWEKGTPKMENPPEPIGYGNNYYVRSNHWNGFKEGFTKETQFYTRDKVSLLEHLQGQIKFKQYDITTAKRKLEETQENAKKLIELCGVIEVDIDTLQDEINEMILHINKIS